MWARGFFGLATFLIGLGFGSCAEQTLYIAIQEEIWDYTPGGRNEVTGESVGENRFWKAVYRQYSDSSFSSEVPKPAWLGFLGPVITAHVDDVIKVHLFNNATRPYSIHPHGLFYEKDSEGALYPDGTKGGMKDDDSVAPGSKHTYTWHVKSDFAPAKGDAPCLPWAYHSHVDAPRDIAAGLVGPMLTCRKGESLQVDKEFFLMFNAVDENMSWYAERNGEEEFPLKHSINGYMFGTLPDLKVCAGGRVAWHILGMGNEADVHSVNFRGNTLLERGHRRDVISVFPASFTTATMHPMATGKWMLSCLVSDHREGPQAFYEVVQGGECQDVPTTTLTGGRERHYYIMADETTWDYGPLGYNNFTHIPLTQPDSDAEVYFGKSHGALGGQYLKARYVAFTDETFTQRKPHSPHLGILGPVISGEVGDTLVVTFFNNATQTFSMEPHALYHDGVERGGASVSPGSRFTYRWRVLDGPTPSDPACQSFLYYSAHDAPRDTNAGLVGPIKICKRGTLEEDGTQRGVNKEFFLLFGVFDENLSGYLDKNIELNGGELRKKDDEDFKESNKMHAINGRMYGNLEGLDMCEGDQVVWYTLGVGSQVDIHGVYFQGNVFQRHGNTRDTLNLFPHTSTTVKMTAHNTGVFSVSCRTTDHFTAGMRHYYHVKQCGKPTHTDPQVHTPTRHVEYFLSAEEVEWDYAPSRDWELEKHNMNAEDSYGSVFLNESESRIGSRYKKAVFRQYTDASFKTPAPNVTHLGIMGPILRMQVGEQVSVVFKNKASRHYSLHPHGVEPQPNIQSSVAPGDTRKYLWNVPARVGPGPNDPPCITYAYYSTADYTRDLASGLVGPLVVCSEGVLKDVNTPSQTHTNSRRRRNTPTLSRRRGDVEKEFALLFMVFDENESWYLQDNILKHTRTHIDTSDPDFMESNKMHGINGRLYGTLKGLEMSVGDRVVWYLITLGNEVDMHTVHFHAHTFTYQDTHTHAADVFDLFPGTFQTVAMTAKHPGTWLLHCHVADHIHAGMETTYTILTGARAPPTSQPRDAASPTGQPKKAARHRTLLWVSLGIMGVLCISIILLIRRTVDTPTQSDDQPPENVELTTHTQS
ncbi:ferroxidase HEPHL1-like [Engraulis encrasicolus]|uniref:ferroxidase HEPHL1-like n=1 Tax=Engraulis encrasicolus TaxID=184585 RepID=UPI002FD0591B